MSAQRISKLFLPKVIVPPGKARGTDLSAVSQKLLGNLGLVKSIAGGTNIILPVALRSLDKLIKIVKTEMVSIGAQEISLPSLTNFSLFNETGRNNLPELFRLKDRHGKNLVLGPTHEEAVVDLVASVQMSYKDLPLQLFQVSTKFRDEIKPRFGLMRSKEFIMKDMYCFESSPEASLNLYNLVNESYKRIFRKLGVPFCCVEGNTGDIGGSISHEFHFLSRVGEDHVVICAECGSGKNQEYNQDNKEGKCSNCSSSKLEHHEAIEVGHSFLLGTRYTKSLQATFTDSDHSQRNLEMSCHGIGLSRLVAASVEVSSSQEELKWPKSIAPYTTCLIPPKAGSKEEKTNIDIDTLQNSLHTTVGEDLIIDDRTDLTIGKRVKEAKQMGIPFLVIVGKAALDNVPRVEFFDVYNNTPQLLEPTDVINHLMQRLSLD